MKVTFSTSSRYSLVDAENLRDKLLLEWKSLDSKKRTQMYDKFFWREVLPIIKVAKIENAAEISFTGADTKNSFDGILYLNDGTQQKVECTTSIDMYLYKTKSKYLEQHGETFSTPETKAEDYLSLIVKERDANGKIVKKFKKRDEAIAAAKINFDDFPKKDIEVINKKLDQKYFNYWLILTTRHYGIEYSLEKYKKWVSDFWNNTLNNPFDAIFILDDKETATCFKLLYKYDRH